MAKENIIVDKEITDRDEIQRILSWDSDSITISLIISLFTSNFDPKTRTVNKSKYNVNDYFMLPKEKFNTAKSGWTSLGIYIVNLHIIQPKFAKIFGYINKPFDGKVIESVEDKLSEELYYDRINTDDMADYYNRLQWLGGHDKMSFLSPSITPALLKPPPGLMEKKKKLFNEYAKELDSSNPNNAIVASKIEAELIKDATDYLKTQDGYENFASKSKININNNYKTINIMKGALLNSYTNKYIVNSSEYNTGISKDEYASLADSGVLGAYMRAVNTAVGGYSAKKSNQGLNTVIAGAKGSDCKSRGYLDIYLYPSMTNAYMNRYIIDDNKGYVELTPDNINQYVNKKIKLRSAMYCLMDEPYYCNICLGNQPYLLGLEHFGLAISRISNKLLTLSMKKFHDLTVKVTKIDPLKLTYVQGTVKDFKS